MNIASGICRVVLLVLLLPAVSGCPKQTTVWVSRQDHFEVAVEDATGLEARSHNGAQSVRGIEDHGNKVIVEAEVEAGGPSHSEAQAALDAIAVSVERKGERIDVRWDWTTAKSPEWKSGVGFSIKLPPALNVKLITHNGGISVRGVAGNCTLETHNGAILADASGARMSASTHNGDLDITTTATEVSLNTHNGGVIARLGAEGDVGGHITSHNGGIRVKLADTAAVALDCKTANGRIHCDHNLEQAAVSKTSLKGFIREGQETLHLETANGSIKIQ